MLLSRSDYRRRLIGTLIMLPALLLFVALKAVQHGGTYWCAFVMLLCVYGLNWLAWLVWYREPDE